MKPRGESTLQACKQISEGSILLPHRRAALIESLSCVNDIDKNYWLSVVPQWNDSSFSTRGQVMNVHAS